MLENFGCLSDLHLLPDHGRAVDSDAVVGKLLLLLREELGLRSAAWEIPERKEREQDGRGGLNNEEPSPGMQFGVGDVEHTECQKTGERVCLPFVNRESHKYVMGNRGAITMFEAA